MIASSESRRMLLSIHDVSPKFLPRIDRLADHLAVHAGDPAVALLVVPDHWREAPIAHDAGFKAWLRDRHAAGAEILLHGWSHLDELPATRAFDRLKGRHLTAGEGEFLTLPAVEALRRIEAGRSLLEDIIGDRVDGFVAPAWLYGPGARAALTHARFRFAEDHFRVWSPADGARLASGPVVTWATRSLSRRLSSIGFAALARAILHRAATVRIGVHPGDTGAPAVMDSIGATLRHFRRTHRPSRYADLLAGRDVPARAPRARRLLPQE